MTNKINDQTIAVQVLKQLSVGFLLLDFSGTVLYANTFFTKYFGRIQGHPIAEILTLDSKKLLAELLSQIENKARKRDHELAVSLHAIGKDKEQHRINFEWFLDREPEHNLLLGVLNLKPVNLKLEEALAGQLKQQEYLKNELEQETELSEMKSRFVSIASHEFRTPLAGILSSLNLINRYLETDQKAWKQLKNQNKIKNHLAKISESVKNLTTILNKFLSLANIEKGEIPVRFVHFKPADFLEEQKTNFQQLSKAGQEIVYTHSGEKRTVFLDKQLFKNITDNLISNAIKFSPENTKIRIVSTFNNESFELKIMDEGIGIPVKDKSRIFRRFFRAKNALSQVEGTGLGLNIVKKYTELMQGTIRFESTENVGTTFIITFPNEKEY